MKLPTEGARWFVQLRWLACALVVATVGLTWALGVVLQPWLLLAVAAGMAVANAIFWLTLREWDTGEGNVDRHITWQILADVLALLLLLYFSDLPRNPFLFYFVQPLIIAGMYLRGRTAHLFGVGIMVLVGGCLVLEYLGWIPRWELHFSEGPVAPLGRVYLLSLFVAFASTLWIAVYFATSIRAYVDRAHDEIRQKEKMLGIGQLVAGIGHQIANPLDGVQNCLRRIGEHVQDDPHLTEYVQMMEEALERIEKTTKRVQAFARPRGIELQDTSVNAAVEATLQLLNAHHAPDITIRTELADVPLVRGDPYTVQEVLFNLGMNALAAMPRGGVLTFRTLTDGRHPDLMAGDVAIEVKDTGVGIPPGQFEKIFEPFYTTRAASGGTGLGLGLCRMLISEMGGRIRVRSALNQGTTFTVILRRSETSAAGASKKAMGNRPHADPGR
jgi:signal transduction histidine kinase